MATEQGLYAHVVMILQNESENKKEREKTKKYNFQGKYAISKRWFDLDHDWLEENFMTREPCFYKKTLSNVLGVMVKKHINYFQYQLVMKK